MTIDTINLHICEKKLIDLSFGRSVAEEYVYELTPVDICRYAIDLGPKTLPGQDFNHDVVI